MKNTKKIVGIFLIVLLVWSFCATTVSAVNAKNNTSNEVTKFLASDEWQDYENDYLEWLRSIYCNEPYFYQPEDVLVEPMYAVYDIDKDGADEIILHFYFLNVGLYGRYVILSFDFDRNAWKSVFVGESIGISYVKEINAVYFLTTDETTYYCYAMNGKRQMMKVLESSPSYDENGFSYHAHVYDNSGNSRAITDEEYQQYVSNPESFTFRSIIPSAVKYVPYTYLLPYFHNTGSNGEKYSISEGKLPSGLEIDPVSGIITGVPTEVGVFRFTVCESTRYTDYKYPCTLNVLWQGGVDVEKDNETGYGFVETATDNGRVHDQFVSSTAELKPQIMHCEGAFSEFYALYLDAQKLTRGTDYTASAGSTRLTLSAKTLADAGSGVHVLSAEFHTKSNNGVIEIKYTTQKYTVTGIPGKNVNVVVKGVPLVWTDAEPYVNKDSRTMVPFRAIADALGLTVEWDGTTREAIFSNGSKTIYFPLDSKTARTSTRAKVTMDTAAISLNGRSYAPVRYLAEFFDFTVSWDGKTRTVSIS